MSQFIIPADAFPQLAADPLVVNALQARGLSKVLLSCDERGLTISARHDGLKAKFSLVLDCDALGLTINVLHVLIQGIPAPASEAEKIIHAMLPGVSYSGGYFRLPWHGLRFANADATGVVLKW